jgi:hypothetical protein
MLLRLRVSTVNDYKLNPVTDRGNPQTAREHRSALCKADLAG